MLSGSRFPNPCFLWRCRSSPSTSPACPTSSRTHYNRIRPCLGSSTSTHSQCTLTIFFRTVRVQLVHATSAAAYIIPWAPVCFSYTFALLLFMRHMIFQPLTQVIIGPNMDPMRLVLQHSCWMVLRPSSSRLPPPPARDPVLAAWANVRKLVTNPDLCPRRHVPREISYLSPSPDS